MKASTLLLIVCLGAGCSQRQDLTDPPDPNKIVDPASDPLAPQTCVAASPVDAGTPPPVVAVWDGYMEQTFWATGDDQVHVVVRSSDTGQLSATGVFGVAAPPPPPPETSDSCDPVDPVTTSATTSAGSLQLLEGFEYQLTAVAMSDVRLQFNLPTYQPLASWCACQAPVEDSMSCLPSTSLSEQSQSDGGSSCTATFGSWGGHPAERVTISCCRLSRCLRSMCQCNPSGCSYNDQFLSQFDLSINGTHADGSALHLIRTQ